MERQMIDATTDKAVKQMTVGICDRDLTKQHKPECPVIHREINKMIYEVGIHFNNSEKETMLDKIERMIRRDIQSEDVLDPGAMKAQKTAKLFLKNRDNDSEGLKKLLTSGLGEDTQKHYYQLRRAAGSV